MLIVVVAVLIGGISGFIGGKLDLVVQRFVDTWMAFPGLLILLTVMSIVGRGLPQIIVVLGILGGIAASRIVRSAVIGVKDNDYSWQPGRLAPPRPKSCCAMCYPILWRLSSSSSASTSGGDYFRGRP